MRVKTQARRDAIIEAATEVFREVGFEAASMARINAKAGGSKATLYNYFPSKEALFIEVMKVLAKEHFDAIFAVLDVDNPDLRAVLQAFGEKSQDYLCCRPSMQTRRALTAEGGKSDVAKRYYAAGPRRGIVKVAALLKSHMAAGRLRKADPELAATQFMALLDCETVTPLVFGLEASLSKTRIRRAVERAVDTFISSYGVPQAGA